jgi:lysophospholipase L1-like esterase
MTRVHARFGGRPGTFAHFGDSITVSLAFWSPLPHDRKNASPEMERAYRLFEGRLRPECWRDWKGPGFGNDGGRTIRWAVENVKKWLAELNPEVALIMFGTNDLTVLERDEYREGLRAVVRRCLDNGTVAILSTIPPRHGHAGKAAAFADAAREVARELAVPLVDYHAEILRRRPDDWDGASEEFRKYEGYDVPTLISRDGVHASAPGRFGGDYSEEALWSHGYNLRNHLVLMAYAEVLEALAAPRPVTGAEVPHRPWFPEAPPLPPPAGEVIRVGDVGALQAATRRVKPGGTILLADGVYPVTRTVVIAIDRVTLRSASGRREGVVLDGGGTLGELLILQACSGVTVADLTVRDVRWNGIKLDTATGVQRATVRNCILHNIWQRAIKGAMVPEAGREATRPRDGLIEYCLFTNDHAKRFEDDPADTPGTFDGNYVGGIDLMYPIGWTIRDNVFLGIKGRAGGARGAIFLWHDARDCVVERNVIVDCDSGICLGNSHRPDDVPIHCTGVVVRNNFLCRVPENGILADYTRDCAFFHNTIHDPASRLGRLIRLVHDNDGLRVINNLLSGPPLRIESDSQISMRSNPSGDFTAAFMAPGEGNLRLKAEALDVMDKAVPLPEVTTDIDRKPADRRPTSAPTNIMTLDDDG